MDYVAWLSMLESLGVTLGRNCRDVWAFVDPALRVAHCVALFVDGLLVTMDPETRIASH